MTLEIKGLEFSYGSKRVLEDINLEIGDTDIVSILGPNGVGKTTLLKCICRVHHPRKGTIDIEGKSLKEYSNIELARTMSYVPQKAVASMMTVYDSILIGRKPHVKWAISKKDIDYVWNVIKLFHMEPLALKYTDEISGGELQKAQIARAVVQDTSIMVLDEPTNNLDIANQHNIMYLLTQLVEKRHMCVIMTMHDINIALRYSTKFIFVKDGRVLAYGGREVVTSELIKEVYNIDVSIITANDSLYAVPYHDQESFRDIDLTGLGDVNHE